MLNNMVASFTASNQIGEAMKKDNLKKKKVPPTKKIDNKGRGDGVDGISSEPDRK